MLYSNFSNTKITYLINEEIFVFREPYLELESLGQGTEPSFSKFTFDQIKLIHVFNNDENDENDIGDISTS